MSNGTVVFIEIYRSEIFSMTNLGNYTRRDISASYLSRLFLKSNSDKSSFVSLDVDDRYHLIIIMSLELRHMSSLLFFLSFNDRFFIINSSLFVLTI